MRPPLFWLEKMSCLLLAAHLDGAGWDRVMLSVPPRLVGKPDEVTRTDWARSVKAVLDAGRPFVAGELKPAHDVTTVTASERVLLRLGLRSILEDLLAGDLRSPYRYDGIWHDDGGNVDLVAWRGSEVLTVEAKGITLSGEGYSWSAAEKSTASVAARDVGRALANSFGYLIPDDRDVTGKGRGRFVATLLTSLPELPEGDQNTIFLVAADGHITEYAPAELRRSVVGK